MKTPFLRMALTALAIAPAAVFAQGTFPDKPINYIIPFVPGGESDIAARLQGKVASKLTGKDFVVQNKAGAGGALAWGQLNSLPGDGYTVVGSNLPHIILQPLEGQVQYKTDDIVNVFFFHYTPDALVVAADSPYKTFADLAAAAKASPGKLTIAGSGTNSANHMAFQRLEVQGKLKMTYVPFKGTGDLTTALLGKHVDAAMTYPTFAVSNKEKTRVLAVATPNRLPQFPNTPTFRELGFDWVDGAYRGIAVPKSTPEAVRKQISDLFLKINSDPEHRKQMQDGGYEQIDITYDQVGDFMKKRAAETMPLARQMGLLK
ncbi:Bug family tripartite tricarboxylate transporter substrate binding protein [Casimicrobium huifangae]|mgnify:FL=1|uniref:Bug family tripartite tricarboxylate transporter substrate binding protein n=1 Tax=Casimicrobium huifangae TaxID=2591109 RepID=UPI002C5A9046|nr:tripartite tricarboxylate transporter substrate binding protein [Casimicrobium huifangae]HQA34962.1 tripartite tricarboxylate transporter substrate binding protein [Casimicrobium huifangae]